MRNLNYYKAIILSILSFVFSTSLYAQDGVSELIKSGPADAQKLAQAYLNPLFKGLGFGMNSAWYNSAKAKNLGRFDIRIQGSGAFVPPSDQTFDISTLGLSSKTRVSGSPITPTSFGENRIGSKIELYSDKNEKVGEFNMPNGTGLKVVPSPQIQLTVGIIKNTDVSIRYSPEIGKGSDYGSVQVLGFGLKHEVTKLFFGKAAKIIPIDLAVGFGYNQIKYQYQVKQADQVDDSNSGQNLNQRVEGSFSGYTFDAILSKKLSIFTPFVSIGYNTSKTDIGMLGKYIIQTDYERFPGTQIPDQSKPIYTTFTDPVKIKQNDIAGLRANVGFALHLAFFRIYAAYGVGQYSAFTGGIGFGIGK
ncbi:MAG: hypothetical protein IE931_09090 [Sphingobacteriales bacterium]|nr:hypothetical protein [Sphingobacteriales bacterium]